MTAQSLYLGIDIDGTNIKIGLVDETGQVTNQHKRKTPQNLSDLKLAIIDIVDRAKAQVGDQLKGVAFSAPGRVVSETGVVHVGGAIPFIDGLNFKTFIQENFGLPAAAINDGKAAAQAELWQGHLTDVDNGLVLLLGTGVGGGIVLNGQLHQGSHFQAGELSYMYASSSDMTTENAMGRRGSAVVFVNKSRELLGLAPGDGEEVFQALDEGTSPEVTALFDQYCQDIVYIIHTLQISLDLDRVIFGGGISAQPLLLEGIQNKYNEIRDQGEWFKNLFEPIDIGLCKYGSEANLIGAVYQLLIEM